MSSLIVPSAHLDYHSVPSRRAVSQFLDHIVSSMFPCLGENGDTIPPAAAALQREMVELLSGFDSGSCQAEDCSQAFFNGLQQVYDAVLLDAEAICAGDPAAGQIEEVIIAYPGFYAILVYRLAHWMHHLQIPVIPRMFTENAHRLTGIDIHPGARIGKSFCIDHGTGIVIGETTEIGNEVKIYQGVTLGASSVSKEKAGKKRHPTLEDKVIVYSGTTILGGNTRIGHHSIVGGNVWLTHSVAPYSLVINRSEVHLIDKNPESGNVPDFVI